MNDYAPAGISPRREIPRRHPSGSCVYIEIKKYLQLKYTVSMPEKISICLMRGPRESLGNGDVSIVRIRKEDVKQKIPAKGSLIQ